MTLFNGLHYKLFGSHLAQKKKKEKKLFGSLLWIGSKIEYEFTLRCFCMSTYNLIGIIYKIRRKNDFFYRFCDININK